MRIPPSRTMTAIVYAELALSVFASFAFADFSGRVVGVSGRDTITVLHDHEPVKVRLYWIVCPEKGQPYSAAVFGKKVKMRDHGLDNQTFKRTLGDVVLPDRTVLNESLLTAGLAWWYQKHTPKRADLAELEAEARLVRRGPWGDPEPVPPWEWEKLQKGMQSTGKNAPTQVRLIADTKSKPAQQSARKQTAKDFAELHGPVRTVIVEEEMIAQDKSYIRPRKTRSLVTYDPRGNIIESEFHLDPWASDPKDDFVMRDAYTYNANGDRVTETAHHTGQPRNTTRTEPIYNAKGQKIEENKYTENGELYWKTVFVYDDKGHLIEEISPPVVSSGLLNRNFYKYDTNDNIIEHSLYKNGAFTWKRTYRYGSKNNVIEQVYGAERWVRTFDTAGKITRMDHFQTYKHNNNIVEILEESVEYTKHDTYGNWVESSADGPRFDDLLWITKQYRTMSYY